MKKLYQKGSVGVAILVGFLALIVAGIAICALSYVSANNYGAEMEASLRAAKTNNENILAQYGQKLTESAQIPEMARDDLIAAVKATIEGRYGDNGSQASVLMLKEHNIAPDSQLYRSLQQLIESGRDEFKQGQTKMVELRRQYETNLEYTWRGTWLRIAGRPKINLDDFKPVSTDYAQDAFKKGKESGPIILRKPASAAPAAVEASPQPAA